MAVVRGALLLSWALLVVWHSGCICAGEEVPGSTPFELGEQVEAASKSLHQKGRALLRETTYPLAASGNSLLTVITSLQKSKVLNIGLHGGSLAAAVTHRLGVYLLRPPESNTTSLVANQTRWLATSAARNLGWQALAGASAAATAQQTANTGGIALVVAPAGCFAYSKGEVALIAPDRTATARKVSSSGPTVALATRTGTAAAIFGKCFRSKRLHYYRFQRPAPTQPLSAFTKIWINSQYPDAQYLFDVAPGGRGDTVVIYYTGTKIQCFTRYLYISLGFDTTGWTRTAWYKPYWGSAGTKPYHFEYDMPQINFTLFNANASLIYYKYKHSLSVMAPQPGSGGCASCGFWYSEDPKQALAFYVTSRSSSTLRGKLLTYFGSPLVASEVLTDQEHPSNLRIFYQPGDAVPYDYSGTRQYDGTFSGQLIWLPKWGTFSSEPDSAVATFVGNRLKIQYYDNEVWFSKGTQSRAGLPRL